MKIRDLSRERRRPRRGLLPALAMACSTLLAVAVAAGPSASAATLPVTWSTDGFTFSTLTPDKPPPGANDWSCRSTRHPVPVVLVHGTFANQSNTWKSMAPYLANNGYCVYTFTYGLKLKVLGGLTPVAQNAAELKAFVEQVVLPRTGATKVDLVGHSQGGLMPRYYIKFLGGYLKVRKLVAISPSNHGTTASGLVSVADFLRVTASISRNWPALTDQITGSALQRTVAGCPFGLPAADICAGDPVRYTVIQTTQDKVVTPFTNAFLKGATNILIQEECPLDKSGHMAMVYDRNVGYQVLKALGPSTAGPRVCVATGNRSGG